ncbi:AAA family ATPase [Bradyrhizobium sp. Arg68]|uniref:ATP-binding protein n=1 Tax=Bradyrhizobium ivorense TaxID=2511166 RepID=UPI001E33ABB6|nr:ATP-binding protein [Bradyrhizobium ivorense]MCC8936023.1 AAA family ATPase [Bradyrhizobium ivorense]
MRYLAELTLDEVVESIVRGEALQITGGRIFQALPDDSRRALAFYNQDRRAFWNPERDTNVLENEIDRLLNALDRPLPAGPEMAPSGASVQKWQLARVEAHRFRGLHRHCADNGRDPDTFQFDVSADVTLLRGFNGAGKTSLVSAICWCLTGYGFRSQALPAPLHEAIEVRLSDQPGSEADISSFELPPIVPIPNEEELVWVDGTPKHDTWVKLTFVSLIDGRAVIVERHLERQGRKSFTTHAVGLHNLGLTDLALQVGSLMPGIAASTRFDDRTTLSQAISTLTGLRPLAHFGKRSERVYDRLTKKYPDEAAQAKTGARKAAVEQIQTLHDLLKTAEGLPTLECVLAPEDQSPDRWRRGLSEAEAKLVTVEDAAAADTCGILGNLPSLTTDANIKRFAETLASVRSQFTSAALKGLPSIQTAQQLGAITAGDAEAAEAVLAKIENEGRALLDRLSDAERANRIRLYGLVARWHEAAHPGASFTECPICQNDFSADGSIPHDTLVGQSVLEALEAGRSAQVAALLTAEEWERSTAQQLRELLPECTRPFIDKSVPDTLGTLYKSALSVEVFRQPDFPGAFRNLAVGLAKVCDKAWSNAPQPNAAPPFNLPGDIPDQAGLRGMARNVLKAISLARYRSEHAEFARTAMRDVLEGEQTMPAPITELSVAAQLALVERYLESARHFAGVRRQLAQIKETCEKWEKAGDRITKLARAAEAVKPFTAFPQLVNDQVESLIANLQSQAASWADRMYRAAFTQGPSYAGFDVGRADGLNILAAQGRHVVEAHHIMNASALRVYLSAFVLALWQQIWERSGGIATVLMDDPQDLLDAGNVANLAAAVPDLLDVGVRPFIVSNDFGFIPAIEDYVRARQPFGGAKRTRVWEFSAVSRSKCTATLAPLVDEVRDRRDAWKANENNPSLARAFAYPVRVRIEAKLWDLLASDPVPLNDPTLDDLLSKIANARNQGQQPFNEEPFRKLLELAPLRSGAPFRDIINEAHHGRADRITPVEAETVNAHFDEVFAAIDACWLTYARFMRRLPAEANAPPSDVIAPNVVSFPDRPIPIIGRFAAREPGAGLATIENASEFFSLTSLGPVALFTLRAPTLGLVAFPGQTLLTVADAEIRNGDLAVVLTVGKTYARRIGLDRTDLSRIVLEALPSANPNVPPTHFLERSKVRLMKIVGVLFDDVATPHSQGEASPAVESPVLGQVVAAGHVAGDSAFPVARSGGRVLLGAPPGELGSLAGRIIAVMTRTNRYSQEYLAYLKRLGKAIPSIPDVYYLENVGETGEGEYVRFPCASASTVDAVPLVEQYWKVHGTLF